MKNIFTYGLILVSTILFSSCIKQIEGRTDNLTFLQPLNADLNAGTWKTILLNRPDTFALALPLATTHVNYIAELNEIKGLQKKLTNLQASNIRYWSAGGVLRWNETMRELVAKYNLPPFQNPDGTYPIPSAANPFAYPLFPFANPPYAARAYAYIAAAQYDALVACWHYKKLYNRPAPSTTDAGIIAKNGNTTLLSYSTKAAVIAGVTAEMMKLLFPTEIGAIEQKAKLHQDAAIMSGSATRSDVVAGENLGRQIAQVFIARARTDNAGKAVGTPADWSNFETSTIAKGEIGVVKSINKKLTLKVQSEVGFSIGEDSVPFFDFVLGGYGFNSVNNFKPFYGYDFLSIAGDSYFKSCFTLDYEFYKKNHFNLAANYANVQDQLFENGNWLSKPTYNGYAIGYGLESIIGPIEIKYSWSPELNKGYTLISIGFCF